MISGFKRRGKQVCLFIMLVYLAGGCASRLKRDEVILDAQYYFDRGMEMMNKKDYAKAIENFTIVVESFSGSALVPNAQFMLGEAHFTNEEYLTAAFEYERVYIDYSLSQFAPQAHYKKALCYYMESPKAILDQENTQLAIDEFNRFIDNYPSHPLVNDSQKKIEELRAKLAYKEYSAAEFYKKSKEYEAALIYYRYVINQYPRSIWANYARYGIGEIHFARKDYEMAREMFLLIINADVDVDLKEKAEEMLEEIETVQTK